MPQHPDPLLDEDSNYASSEDPDFAPDAATQAPISDSSGSESETEGNSIEARRTKEHARKGRAKSGRRKREKDEGAKDLGFENSGDEEVVETGLKKRRKRSKKDDRIDDDESDGGNGGFVRTRRMAALATEEKKSLASTAGAAIDVDAIWASMTSGTVAKAAREEPTDVDVMEVDETENTESSKKEGSPNGINESKTTSPPSISKGGEPDDMVMIQRTYNFAGKVHTEEKLVARDSAEAKLWLQSQESRPHPQPSNGKISKALRPPKKARRSIFEPMTDPLPQRADLRLGAGANPNRQTTVIKAEKLNTVEKSKMDWAGYVDKEGIKDELEMAGKAKGSYLDQSAFLARVEEKREEDARNARLKNLLK